MVKKQVSINQLLSYKYGPIYYVMLLLGYLLNAEFSKWAAPREVGAEMNPFFPLTRFSSLALAVAHLGSVERIFDSKA